MKYKGSNHFFVGTFTARMVLLGNLPNLQMTKIWFAKIMCKIN